MTPAASGSPARIPSPRTGRAAAWLAALCLLAALFAPAAGAQAGLPLTKSLIPPDPDTPWEIEADRISYDQFRDEYVAEGGVVIRRQDRQLKADTVIYNLRNLTASARGNVVIIAGDDIVTGESAEWDLQNETGRIENGTVFIAASNYRIRGNRIEKTGPDTYRIDQGTLTTCDGAPPDWKISARDITVHTQENSTAWHAVGYVRNVPAGYYPYVSFPPPDKRTSGLLVPQGGYSSRRGVFAAQPYYWVIDDSSDATFYLQGMSRRGWRPGVEYRYYLTREARGAAMFDYLHDEQTDTGGNSSKEWGFRDSGGEFLRPNRDRYWFRMSHENPLPAGFRARLELDTVSDQDYLREFNSGYMGFKDSADYFRTAFGRSLAEDDDPLRPNVLLLSRFWPSFSLNAETDWYNDVRKGQRWQDTTQRLPLVQFGAPKQPLFASPVFANLNSQYVNFWKGSGGRVQRADIYPRFYYPLALPPYLSFEPSAGLRQTVWNIYESDAADPWSDGPYSHRELYDGRLSLFTNLFRTFDVDRFNIARIRHAVRPQVSYTYVPEVDQESLPLFDSRDRVENRSRVTYSVTNTLTSRFQSAAAAPETDPRRPTPRETVISPSENEYLDILRLRVLQNYDFARHDRPFSPVIGKLQFFPGKYISLDSEAAYNTYEDRLDRYNIGMTLWARQRDRLRLEYRYDRDPLKTEDAEEIEQEVSPITVSDQRKIDYLFTELRLGLTDRFTSITSYENDFEDGSSTYGVGFAYAAQCWTLETLFSYGSDDIEFELRLRLKGLGEFGF
jgi:LPS-assembly protein